MVQTLFSQFILFKRKLNKFEENFASDVVASCYYSLKLQGAGDLNNKTMADKLMYIPNDDLQNYPFRRR